MFKIFKGFDLVEALHQNKQIRRIERLPKHFVALAFTLAVTLTLWNMPIEMFGIPELTIVQQRTIALFAFATLMWLLEVIPSWCTSVAIIAICIFTMSNDAFFTFTKGIDPEKLGTLLSSKEVMATFADPIIILFLGGFMLAIAATKTGLDVKLARVLLKPFGKKSTNVLLGFLLITGFFSMFVSNTATAAMMIAFLAPVLKAIPDAKGRTALLLAIPIGANIGGMGTPIGTPPNAIANKILDIPFGEWMLFMFPFVIVILLLSWVLLRSLFPFQQKEIELKIEGESQGGWHSTVVNVTFLATIALWTAVGEWNDWRTTLYYVQSPSLHVLQYKLMQTIKESERIISLIQSAMEEGQDIEELQNQVQVTPESLQAAQVVVVTLPIICLYPFLQKYFVKGVTLGSVKG